MTKTPSSGKDFLGLLALGGTVLNVVEAISRRRVQTKRVELRGYVIQLRRLYQNLIRRYRIAAHQYGVLRDENVRLWSQVQKLHDALSDAQQRNNQLVRESAGLRQKTEKLEAKLAKKKGEGSR